MSGKKFDDAVKKYDRDQLFTPTEAIALVKSLASAKFDETVEIALRLGVDPRKADQMVRGTVNLPNGTGRRRASRCSRWARRPRPRWPPAPTWWAATT